MTRLVPRPEISQPSPSAASMTKRLIDERRLPRRLPAQAGHMRQMLGRIRLWGRQLWITRLSRRLWWTTRMGANEGICSVEIKNKSTGFFAQLTWCLCILQYCERHGLVPDIRLTGDVYLDRWRGPNWLDYYFDVLTPMIEKGAAKRVRYTRKIVDFHGLGPPIAPAMTIDDASRIVREYLRPKPHIAMMVDDFWTSLNVGGPVVGVHFRGTDKSSEAPRVSRDHCLAVLQKNLRDDASIKAVFVASDEQEVIDLIKDSVTAVPVYSHEDHYRSSDGQPVHTKIGQGSGYKKGEDALVNALLFSKCSTLIRTSSFLSAWASIFNPGLKVILLNKPYPNKFWFPESEIFSRRDTEYFPERPH
jgi:hypothetical protein